MWRGAMNNKVRTALMNVGRDQGWADVKEMNSQTRLNMVDFCRYKFPIHTEGNTWSGRLRYLQNCDSVTVIHQPLEHQAHFYDLLIAEGPDQVREGASPKSRPLTLLRSRIFSVSATTFPISRKRLSITFPIRRPRLALSTTLSLRSAIAT